MILVGVCVALTFVAYLPTLHADFINLDDNDYVYANETIRSFSNLKSMLTEPLQGNYHPLTVMSLAMNYAISGNNASSYHWLNLLLHLANTVLVFWFVWQLSGRKTIIAFCAALFFGVHPMHVESVAWIAERKDVLYTFFGMMGLIAYLRYIDNKDKSALWLSFLLFVLSIASKPAAIVFPLSLVVIDIYRQREWRSALLVEKIPFFAISLIMALLTLKAQTVGGATDTSNAFGIDQRAFFGFYSFMMYIAKMFVPINLAIFYPLPTMHQALPAAYYLAPLVFFGLAGAAYWAYRKERVFAFGLLFFFVNIVLVLQWKVIGSTIMAERYTYVPYIGLFVIVGWVIDHYLGSKRNVALATISAVGFVFCGLSYAQASVFVNNTALWDNAMEHQPSERAYTNRASLLRSEGKLDSALVFYDKGLAIFPNDQWALCNRANIYFDQHKDSLAEADYTHALSIIPDFVPALMNRGALYVRAGKNDVALKDLNRAIELKPQEHSAYLYRAVCLFNGGRHSDAIEDYVKVCQSFPNDMDSRYSLGMCYKITGQTQKALSSFNECIAKRPTPQAFQMRSECELALGMRDQAKTDATIAMKNGARLSAEFLHQLGLN